MSRPIRVPRETYILRVVLGFEWNERTVSGLEACEVRFGVGGKLCQRIWSVSRDTGGAFQRRRRRSAALCSGLNIWVLT
jgi:hypothetical protein